MPSLKQKLVVRELMENKGKSVSQAMKDVGYPDTTAKNPQQITNSKGFQELLDEYLPEIKLAQVHKEGLEANRTISAISGSKANGGTVDFVDVPDYPTRHKYLETAYKLRKRLSPEFDFTSAVIIPVILKRGDNETEGSNNHIAPQAT